MPTCCVPFWSGRLRSPLDAQDQFRSCRQRGAADRLAESGDRPDETSTSADPGRAEAARREGRKGEEVRPGHLPAVVMTSLLPYSGLLVRQHFGPSRGPHTLTTYCTDRSATKSYHFNSLGFRGEEPSAQAEVRIFVCGCSQAFGSGLNAEETWPVKVRDHLAAMWGIDPGRVDLLNFSQGGASNCYITRMLVSQMTRVRPDLVIALFTHKARYELYGEQSAAHVIPLHGRMYGGTEWAE